MRFSERIYGRLLGLYPPAFLREYREPMQQAFRDHLRGADTLAKRMHLWLRTLVDLGRSLPPSWLRRSRSCTSFGFERWSSQARRSVFFARFEAQCATSEAITVEHLLLGLLRADRALAAILLPNDSVDNIAALIRKTSNHPADARRPAGWKNLPLHSSCKEVLRVARNEMLVQGRKGIDPAHLILAILGQPESPAAHFLRSFGVDEARVRAAIGNTS